jgi:hypothetical protein
MWWFVFTQDIHTCGLTGCCCAGVAQVVVCTPGCMIDLGA